MRISFFSVLLLFLIFVSGCTNAGPYVTDIAFDGEGNLLVTKNTAQFNWFFGTISSGDNEQITTIKMPKAYISERPVQGYQATTDPKTGKVVTRPVYEKGK